MSRQEQTKKHTPTFINRAIALPVPLYLPLAPLPLLRKQALIDYAAYPGDEAIKCPNKIDEDKLS